MAQLNLRDYPPHDAIRTGCKVGWRSYRDRDAAEQCAEAARWNAKQLERVGYDFGYQSPGSITQRDGMYEVCVP